MEIEEIEKRLNMFARIIDKMKPSLFRGRLGKIFTGYLQATIKIRALQYYKDNYAKTPKLTENEKNMLKFVILQYKNALNDTKNENKEIIETQIYCDRELTTLNKIEEKLKL